MLVTWCSTGGAPGVSAWSVLTAGLWPADASHEIAVVEADRSGGVMATRYGIGVAPGSAELVVAATESTQVQLDIIGRRVSESALFVPAPVVPSEAAAVWSDRNIGHVANVAAADARTWCVDTGRFNSSTWLWHEKAALTVVLVPAWTDALVAAQTVVAELAATGRTSVMVVGKPDYELDELAAFLGTDVGTLPKPEVVAESTSVWGGTAWWRRGPVWDAASRLAIELHEIQQLVGRT